MREVHVISSTVIEKEGKILLVQEGKDHLPGVKGTWNLPTGKIDPKDNVIDCAIRETFEETGYNVALSKFIGVYEYYKEFSEQDRLIDIVRFTFSSKIISGEPTTSDEIAQIKWFSIDEITELKKESLLRDEMILQIVTDYFSNKEFPLNLITIKNQK